MKNVMEVAMVNKSDGAIDYRVMLVDGEDSEIFGCFKAILRFIESEERLKELYGLASIEMLMEKLEKIDILSEERNGEIN